MSKIIAINLDSVFEYSLLQDTGDDKVIFSLGVIDSFVRAYIDDTHTIIKTETIEKDNGLSGTVESFDDVAVHNKYLQFVRFGLRDWKNFKDSDGKNVEFKTEVINVPRIGKRTVMTDDTLKKLDLSWIVELGLEIIMHNKLSASESKN